jgi:hypothetical protein
MSCDVMLCHVMSSLGSIISIKYTWTQYYLHADSMLNLSDMTSMFRTVVMFVIVDLEITLHAFVGSFMI